MDSKIKYYSFNYQTGEVLDEGFTKDKPKADYQSSDLNSTIIDTAKILKFENEDYYQTIQPLKDEYNAMMNATKVTTYNDTEAADKANNIYNTMIDTDGYDINEQSAVLEYVNIGDYDKRIVNGFIDKVNQSSEINLPDDIKLQNIE